MNSFVTGGLTAPGSSSTQPTVEDVDEEDEESTEHNPASLLANVSEQAMEAEAPQRWPLWLPQLQRVDGTPWLALLPLPPLACPSLLGLVLAPLHLCVYNV